MPDIGGVYAWLQDGSATLFGYDFPDEKGLPELEDRFEDWQGKFEDSASNIDPEANRILTGRVFTLLESIWLAN